MLSPILTILLPALVCSMSLPRNTHHKHYTSHVKNDISKRHFEFTLSSPVGVISFNLSKYCRNRHQNTTYSYKWILRSETLSKSSKNQSTSMPSTTFGYILYFKFARLPPCNGSYIRLLGENNQMLITNNTLLPAPLMFHSKIVAVTYSHPSHCSWTEHCGFRIRYRIVDLKNRIRRDAQLMADGSDLDNNKASTSSKPTAHGIPIQSTTEQNTKPSPTTVSSTNNGVSKVAKPNPSGTKSTQSSDNTWKIVVGVIIPVIVIIIVVFLVYKIYRRKFPVRMIIGREFMKFRNPDYQRPRSGLALVRDDVDWNAIGRTSSIEYSSDFQTSDFKIPYENKGFQGDDENENDEEKADREFVLKKRWLFTKNGGEDGVDGEIPASSSKVDEKKQKGIDKSSDNSHNDSEDSDIEAMLSEQRVTPKAKRKISYSNSDISDTSTLSDEKEKNTPHSKNDIDSYKKAKAEEEISLDKNENPVDKFGSLYNQLSVEEVRAQLKSRARSLSVSKPGEKSRETRSFSLQIDPTKSARKNSSHDNYSNNTEANDLLRFVQVQKITASVVGVEYLSDAQKAIREIIYSSKESINSNSHLVTDLDDDIYETDNEESERNDDNGDVGDEERGDNDGDIIESDDEVFIDGGVGEKGENDLSLENKDDNLTELKLVASNGDNDTSGNVSDADNNEKGVMVEKEEYCEMSDDVDENKSVNDVEDIENCDQNEKEHDTKSSNVKSSIESDSSLLKDENEALQTQDSFSCEPENTSKNRKVKFNILSEDITDTTKDIELHIIDAEDTVINKHRASDKEHNTITHHDKDENINVNTSRIIDSGNNSTSRCSGDNKTSINLGEVDNERISQNLEESVSQEKDCGAVQDDSSNTIKPPPGTIGDDEHLTIHMCDKQNKHDSSIKSTLNSNLDNTISLTDNDNINNSNYNDNSGVINKTDLSSNEAIALSICGRDQSRDLNTVEISEDKLSAISDEINSGHLTSEMTKLVTPIIEDQDNECSDLDNENTTIKKLRIISGIEFSDTSSNASNDSCDDETFPRPIDSQEKNEEIQPQTQLRKITFDVNTAFHDEKINGSDSVGSGSDDDTYNNNDKDLDSDSRVLTEKSTNPVSTTTDSQSDENSGPDNFAIFQELCDDVIDSILNDDSASASFDSNANFNSARPSTPEVDANLNFTFGPRNPVKLTANIDLYSDDDIDV